MGRLIRATASTLRERYVRRPVTRAEPMRRLSKRNRLTISHVSRYYLEMLRFDWGERKNKSNRIKHGIWFEEAQSVFSDPHGRLFYDPEHSEHEDRFILLGVSSAAKRLS
jgi:hypothetical protein